MVHAGMIDRRAHCPNCGRGFHCDGSADCWCLKVERHFDYEALIVRTGAMACVCPVCLTGRPDPAAAADIAMCEKTGDKG